MNTIINPVAQWQNRGNILTLLLVIGGDVVQRAIAQLLKVHIQTGQNEPKVFLTPVTFSFGQVDYAFASLTVIEEKQLLSSNSNCPSITINFSWDPVGSIASECSNETSVIRT